MSSTCQSRRLLVTPLPETAGGRPTLRPRLVTVRTTSSSATGKERGNNNLTQAARECEDKEAVRSKEGEIEEGRENSYGLPVADNPLFVARDVLQLVTPQPIGYLGTWVGMAITKPALLERHISGWAVDGRLIGFPCNQNRAKKVFAGDGNDLPAHGASICSLLKHIAEKQSERQ